MDRDRLPILAEKGSSLVTRKNVKTGAIVVGGVAAVALVVPVVTGIFGLLMAMLMFPFAHPFLTLLLAGGAYGATKALKD